MARTTPVVIAGYSKWRKDVGLGKHAAHDLISGGHIDSYTSGLHGMRRQVILSGTSGSWEAHVERQLRGEVRPEAERLASAERYRQSLRAGALHAAKARQAIRRKQEQAAVSPCGETGRPKLKRGDP
jgi:hypothetical protein